MAKGKATVNLEYAALRFFCGLVRLVPYAAAMALADALGWFGAAVVGFKRRRTLDRLRTVFPELDEPARRRIARRSLQGFLRTVIELIKVGRFGREWFQRHVPESAKYKAILQGLVDEGRGVVIMVPHTGNWYMPAWAMAFEGLPLFAIAARQRNPKIDAWLKRQYGGIEVLDRDCRDTLGGIRDRLRAGQVFAILPDLRVRKRDVEADFLRGKANVSRAGAMFAVRTGAPIVVAAMRRDEQGRHLIEHLATLRPEGRTAEELTREALARLSDFILAHPADWYWYNKRWVLEPV